MAKCVGHLAFNSRRKRPFFWFIQFFLPLHSLREQKKKRTTFQIEILYTYLFLALYACESPLNATNEFERSKSMGTDAASTHKRTVKNWKGIRAHDVRLFLSKKSYSNQPTITIKINTHICKHTHAHGHIYAKWHLCPCVKMVSK